MNFALETASRLVSFLWQVSITPTAPKAATLATIVFHHPLLLTNILATETTAMSSIFAQATFRAQAMPMPILGSPTIVAPMGSRVMDHLVQTTFAQHRVL